MNRVGALVAVVVIAATSDAGIRGQAKTDATLMKAVSDFETAFNAQDAKKVAALYTEDGVAMPPNRPMVKGRAAIEADVQRDFKAGVTKLKLTPMESAISGDTAYEAGTSTVMVNGKQVAGKYVVIYKRVGQQWLIAFDSYSGDEPPPVQQKP